jgi:hypothetical protein
MLNTYFGLGISDELATTIELNLLVQTPSYSKGATSVLFVFLLQVFKERAQSQ